MRFMMLMIPKGYEKAQPGTMPDAKAVAAMMKYNEALQKAGVLLALDGLHPPSMGARVISRPAITNIAEPWPAVITASTTHQVAPAERINPSVQWSGRA